MGQRRHCKSKGLYFIYGKGYYSNHGVNNVRQTATETADPLAPKPSAFEVQMANEKLKETNHQVMIKFQLYCLMQELGQFVLRSINL